MTINESLISLNTYPIPTNTIDKICIDRELVGTEPYTLAIAESESYQLATADVYLWLYTSPSVKEQEVSFTIADRDNFLSIANKIYLEFDDAKYSGNTFGFIGENYNG